MGGSSKQTVGFWYKMGLHFGISHGPVDKLKQILAGERRAWIGSVTDNETIFIDARNLFGGKKREGGIEGDLDVMMGGPAQTANAYLSDQIDGLMPAFRGIFSCVYKGGYIAANNPYIKPWAFQVERILEGWHGGTWYPSKAPVPIVLPGEGATEVLYEDLALDASIYRGPPNDILPEYPEGEYWLIEGFQPCDILQISVPGGLTYEAMSRWANDSDNGGLAWSNGVSITNDQGITVEYLDWVPDPYEGITYGPPHYHATAAEAAEYAAEQDPMQITGSTFYKLHFADWIENLNRGGVSIKVEKILCGELLAMNPAHIIYQSLTDPNWGMGYPVAQIDDASFTEAADTFFEEGLGLCLIWNQQADIQEFVQLVLDHAGAVYYADPKTGKFKLKALRADYDPDYLPVYDESNIITLDNFQRPGYGETVNEITVVYRDQQTFKDSSITVQDLANIQAQGGVVSQTRQYPGLPVATLAARIAERDVIAASTPLAKCRITVNRSAWQEAPGEVIKVSWDKLGLDGVIFRVLTINYGTLTQGQLVIELAEDVYGLPSTSYSVQESTGFTEPDISPSAIAIQDVLETPYWDIARTLTAAELSFLDPDSAFIMAVASTTNSNNLGFEMFSRISPAAYVSSDAFGSFAPTAILAGSVGLIREATSVIEYTSGINIDTVEVGQRVLIGSGRFAEFAEITDIDTGLAEISVNRGVLDTTPQEHAQGVRLFFNETDFAVDTTERATGESIDVKLTAYSGGGESSLGAALPMNIEADQRHYRPYPPGKIRINGEAWPTDITASGITVTWAHRDRVQQVANYVDQEEASIGPEVGTTYTVRIYLDSDLANTESGITGTTSTFYAPSSPGLVRVEVESVRDSVVSWQMQVREFEIDITDAYFANVSALLHMNGADGSTTFTDVTGKTWTAHGNAQIDTDQYKFGGASGLFDGTGDYISTAAHADFGFGSGDYTVEGFVRAGATGDRTLFDNRIGGAEGIGIYASVAATPRKFVLTSNAAVIATSANAIPIDTQTHWAVCRSGTTVKGFLNGNVEFTITDGRTLASSAAVYIGNNTAGGQYFLGHQDEVRVTKGVARYTAAFTPPSAPFPDS